MIGFIVPVAIQAVAAPAPPPPPKLGTFACEIRDRRGREFSLSGTMRDWQKIDKSETAAFDIEVPQRSELGGRYQATFRGSDISIVKTDSIGQPIAGGVLVADFRPEGTIMLRQGASWYVGFCDVRFTTRDLPA